MQRIRQFVTATPELRPLRDAVITLMAFVGWYAGFYSRASVIALACAEAPASCNPASINALDRWGMVRNYDWLSDHLSYWTQDASAVLALAAFFLLSPIRRRAWAHLVLLLQCTFINGALIEAVRLVVQRPRPFVYFDPQQYGGAPAHYTSFYSGHTSFAALACTCAVLASLDARAWIRRLVLALAALLTAATGLLRVTGSRHFITDVSFGALAGVAIAIAVNSLHREENHANAPASPTC
jgi:membrane-associated phospholipid phosphatase